jgi:hypothetical protein
MNGKGVGSSSSWCVTVLVCARIITGAFIETVCAYSDGRNIELTPQLPEWTQPHVFSRTGRSQFVTALLQGTIWTALLHQVMDKLSAT